MLGIYADIASHFSTSLQPFCSRHAWSLIPPSGVVGQLTAGAVASCMADVSFGTLGSQPHAKSTLRAANSTAQLARSGARFYSFGGETLHVRVVCQPFPYQSG